MYKPAGGPGLAVEMLADDIPPTGRFTAACGEPQAVLEGDFIVATGSAAGQKELSRMERDVFLGGGAGRHRSPTGHWASHAEMLNVLSPEPEARRERTTMDCSLACAPLQDVHV